MALPINIKDLINSNTTEWEGIEFKEGFNKEAIMQTICAFANDLNNWGGGHIIIGIREESGTPLLPPIGLQANQIDTIQKEIINLCHFIDPLYIPIVEPYVYDGKNILVIWAPGGENRPYKAPIGLSPKSQKAYYVKRLSTTTKANGIEEKKLLEQSARIPFDDRINPSSKISDLDINLIQDYLKEIKSDLLEESYKLSLNDLCRKMQIARGPDSNLRPLNIGLMLFTKEPHKYFKGAVIDIVIFNDLSGTKFTEKQISGPLHQQLRNALDYIKNTVIQQQVMKISGQAEVRRIVNYPFEAIEEALVNAVYHRGYEDDNKIEIRIHKDKIEIISYPGPLPPVDQEALMQERVIARDYRNRRIGEYLKELKLLEARGTGIPTIRTKMQEAGCPYPEFISGKDNLYFLTILKPNIEWDQSDIPREVVAVIIMSNEEQIVLESCRDKTLEFSELLDSLSERIPKENLKKTIEALKAREYLNEITIKKLFGLIKVQLYSITAKGIEALKQVF